jgi:hypothetical protein
MQCNEQQVYQFDPNKRGNDAAHSIDEQVVAQHLGRANWPVWNTTQSQRDQCDDQRMEMTATG